MTGFKYPKGSEWRKWDLHVHTPSSALTNQFEGTTDDEKWNKYLAKLASLENISVLGLTDYFSIEGYKKVKAYKDSGHLSNIDYLLPNVELRILPVTSEDTPINLHIIFSSEVVDGLDSKFFSSLEFTYQGEVFKCIRDNLINLGRKYKNDNTIQENIAFRTGIEQFKISFDKIMEKISEALKNSDEQKTVLNKLNFSIEQKTIIEKKISELKSKLLKVEEITSEISVFLENSNEFADKLKDDLYAIGIKKDDADLIKVILSPENLQQIIDVRKKEIDEEIEKQKSELETLDKNIKDLNSKITLEKSKQDKIKEIIKSLADFKKKKDPLTEDIKKAEESEKKLPKLLNERENLFINYFELIFEEKEKLKAIYAPLENILKESNEENEKLFDFTVQFNFNANTMAGEGHNLIDLRHDGLFRQSKPEALEEKIKNLSFKLNLDSSKISDSDKNSIKDFLQKILDLFEKDGRTTASQLKQDKYTELDFDNWLYSTKYFDISYSIKFNGIDLDILSPGLKGVALLILFLELDEEDRRPILIDQPEENLDNRSVFSTLVKYFRNAKERRQVIIVTHNPNLVVNTDSEQIMVADFDRSVEKQNSRIGYVCGSLENTFKDDAASIMVEKKGIREHVCEILEGGQEAFEKRERKYGFKIG